MLSRHTPLIIVIALIAAACSPATPAAEITHPPTSIAPTTAPSTTTTTIPFEVENAPYGLSALVEAFYSYASDGGAEPPRMAKPLLDSFIPSDQPTPRSGVASVATFKEVRIATVEVGDDLFLAVRKKDGWTLVGGRWPSLSIPAYYGDGPRLIAIVGSDARAGETVERTRADSIHFVGLDGTGHAAVVGLPRDSYVPIPGHGTGKVNASLAYGGPDLMMETFANLTELPLEGYILTGFAGFKGLVNDVLGGIDVNVPFPINDEKALATLAAGQQLLGGFDALAFARARKTLPGGDFTRSEHQGSLLIAAAMGVKALGPEAIPRFMEEAEPYILTDLGPTRLLTLLAMAIETKWGKAPNIVAPGSPGWAGSASVVYLSNSASDLFDDLADGHLDTWDQ